MEPEHTVVLQIEPESQVDSQTLLDVQNLLIRYGTFTAVNGVSFKVHAGEIFGLLGPNGAGKTSILSAVEGLLQPQSGSIHVAGFDISKDPRNARANLGVQLQASSFQADLSVFDILKLYSGLYGVDADKAQIDAILANFQLTSVAERRTGQLSGGQQQSVSLATATLHDPPVILLDEPTTGLDPQSRRRLWQRMEKMRDDGCGIVLTTHSMEEAHATCDRIAIIDHGIIITVGTPQGLIDAHKDNPAVLAVTRLGAVTLEDVFIGLTDKSTGEENTYEDN
jgi:ABC-2 type transport system ATP-binding protein